MKTKVKNDPCGFCGMQDNQLVLDAYRGAAPLVVPAVEQQIEKRPLISEKAKMKAKSVLKSIGKPVIGLGTILLGASIIWCLFPGISRLGNWEYHLLTGRDYFHLWNDHTIGWFDTYADRWAMGLGSILVWPIAYLIGSVVLKRFSKGAR